MGLLGSTSFPQMQISGALGSNELEFGPSVSFGNAGMYQNQWEVGSSLNWVKGRHTIAIGGNWDHTQLNVLNNSTTTGTDNLGFSSFLNFVEGNVRTGRYSDAFAGNSNRYYRSDTAGAYVNDNYKVLSNLTVTAGVRWDFDGPLTEKYGRLTAFDPSLYSYDTSSNTITNSGLEIAGNNATFATARASDSLLQKHLRPCSRRTVILAITSSTFSTSTLSVSSNSRFRGLAPVRSRAASTSLTKIGRAAGR